MDHQPSQQISNYKLQVQSGNFRCFRTGLTLSFSWKGSNIQTVWYGCGGWNRWCFLEEERPQEDPQVLDREDGGGLGHGEQEGDSIHCRLSVGLACLDNTCFVDEYTNCQSIDCFVYYFMKIKILKKRGFSVFKGEIKT